MGVLYDWGSLGMVGNAEFKVANKELVHRKGDLQEQFQAYEEDLQWFRKGLPFDGHDNVHSNQINNENV
jgi:hypothetical protein